MLFEAELDVDSTTRPALSVLPTPIELRCDYAERPLAVHDAPWLSWRLDAEPPEDVLIRVRVHRSTIGSGEPQWSSAWLPASTAGVVYAGPALDELTEYTWAVDLRDGDGRTASTSAAFETGPRTWSARWIRQDLAVDNPDGTEPPSDDGRSYAVRYLRPAVYCRTEFELPQRPVRARLYVSARGIYEASVNGAAVGDQQLAPGWTDYRDRIEFQAHDVTPMLDRGRNALGAVLADGWWSGFVGFDRKRQGEHYGDAPELIAELHVEFADGSGARVVTDESWTVASGPIRYADILMGQSVDDRVDLGAWTVAGGKRGEWRPAVLSSAPTATLTSIGTTPVTACETLPGTVVAESDGVLMVDFGQNLVGHVRIDVSALSAGDRLQIRHGETLAADGSLYVENLRTAEAVDHYVAGSAPETFEPRFTSHGFRYAEISGDTAALSRSGITAVCVRSANRQTGAFRIAHAGLQQLQSNIVWGMRGNHVSVPTDCPQRDERLGWLADAQVFLPTAAYNADIAGFYRNWLRDVRYTQDEDGAFADVAPRLRLPQQAAPGWGDAGVIVPWTLYTWYGDPRFLTDAWESMTGWVEHVYRHNPALIWRRAVGFNYGDWLNVGTMTDPEVLATAYFARSAQLVADAADVLGHREAHLRYTTLAADIRAAFVAAFVDQHGCVRGGGQTAQLLALAFDLVPAERRQQVGARLVDAIEEAGRALSTGFLGVALLLPTLTDLGYAGLAWELALREEFPSWLYSVNNGATTIWERWDGWTAEHGFQSAQMNSFNHFSLGSIGEWFYAHAAGIRQAPGSSGFERLALRPSFTPRIDGLAATFDSPRGTIASAWRRRDDGYEWDVTLPPQTTALVTPPAPGRLRTGSTERTFAGPFELASGQHRIHLPVLPGRTD